MFFTEAMRSSFVLIVWSCLCKQIFKVRQTFSIMFRSGLCAGHDSVGIWLPLFHQVVLAETWHGALSSCKVQGSVWKCFAATGHKHWSKTLIYFSEFIFPCTDTSSPTPLYVMHPQNMTDSTDWRSQSPYWPKHWGIKVSCERLQT